MNFKDVNSIDELIKTAQDPFEEEGGEESFPERPARQERFRVSMYVDIFVPDTGDLEANRKEAMKVAENLIRAVNEAEVEEEGSSIGEAYVGEAFHNPTGYIGEEMLK